MSCHELETVTDIQLENMIDQVTVFYRMAPAHKMKIVQTFRRKGKVVAMTGDGYTRIFLEFSEK
jgi:Ca2+-transporting ATPase